MHSPLQLASTAAGAMRRPVGGLGSARLDRPPQASKTCPRRLRPQGGRMSRKYSRLSLRVAVAASAAAATAVFSSSAVAACTPGTSTGCQSVSGTALSSLALTVGTPATFGTSFAPGVSGDQSTGGALVVTDTSPSWHLSVQDQGSGAGHLVADTTLSPLNACNGSESQL